LFLLFVIALMLRHLVAPSSLAAVIRVGCTCTRYLYKYKIASGQVKNGVERQLVQLMNEPIFFLFFCDF